MWECPRQVTYYLNKPGPNGSGQKANNAALETMAKQTPKRSSIGDIFGREAHKNEKCCASLEWNLISFFNCRFSGIGIGISPSLEWWPNWSCMKL